MKRLALLVLIGLGLVLLCHRTRAETYPPGAQHTIVAAWADTLGNSFSGTAACTAYVYVGNSKTPWQLVVLQRIAPGLYRKSIAADSAGFVGDYYARTIAYTIQGRTPPGMDFWRVSDFEATLDSTKSEMATADSLAALKTVADDIYSDMATADSLDALADDVAAVADSVTRGNVRADTAERRLGIPAVTIADDIDSLIDGLLPASGPNPVTLRFLDDSDNSAIAEVWVRIMDENLVSTMQISHSDASGIVNAALAADTFKVIASKLNDYTFTIPKTIIVTSPSLTDTIWGTAFDAGTPDSANVTRIYGWVRALDGSSSEGVIVTVSIAVGSEDLGSPSPNPTLLVLQQAVMDTTDSNGKFSIDLICADEILPEGGTAGTVRHIFEFSKNVRIGPYFITESDTLYIPCTNQKYLYWDTALRP